jgi:hypothetical protein
MTEERVIEIFEEEREWSKHVEDQGKAWDRMRSRLSFITDRPWLERNDLLVFLFIASLFPEKNGDIIVASEHDQFWLDLSVEDLAKTTEEDCRALRDMGVIYSNDGFMMFA